MEPRTLRYFEERSNGQVVYACRHGLVSINGMKHCRQIVVDPQLMLKLVCLFTRGYQRLSHIETILLPARYQQKSEDKSVVFHRIGVSQAVVSSALAHHEHAGTSQAKLTRRMFTFDASLCCRLIGQKVSGANNLSRVNGGVKSRIMDVRSHH